MVTSIWARVAVETQAVVELLQEKHLWALNQTHQKSVKKDQSMSKRMVKKIMSSSWNDYILFELKFFLNLVFFPLYIKSLPQK